MLIYHFELDLDAGFELLDRHKDERLHRGKKVSACSGWHLFSTLRHGPIRCWECRIAADHWIADKGRRDTQGPPVLNLYGRRPNGVVVMMNQDHIIPRSLGGTNDIRNLRPACEVCNGARGNSVNAEEIAFASANPDLMNIHRFKMRMKRAELHRVGAEEGGKKLLAPYEAFLTGVAQDTALVRKYGSRPKNKPPKDRRSQNAKRRAKKVLKSLQEVLITSPSQLAALTKEGVPMRWENVDGKFVGPYARVKEVE